MIGLMEAMAAEKRTENDAYALNTTFNKVVDFFGVCGALRGREESDIIRMWEAAYKENKELAFRMIFYIRNVRGGLGERSVFRTLLKHVANTYPKFVECNMHNIPFYGRYDDLLVLFDTPVENFMIDYVAETLKVDLAAKANDESVTLLAKWLPSVNTSSETTRALANRLGKALNLKPAAYRKTLSSLRKYIEVTEVHMSANDWDKIKYEAVPSNSMNKNNKAFKKHDAERFAEYMEKVNSGEVKINAGVLYPYDLVAKVWKSQDEVCEAQWKELPDYFNGETYNALVMADVSGSMTGQPMMTSIGLAIYFAERNTGAFANSYLTFTATPKIRVIKKSMSLYEKVRDVRSNGVGYDTNLKSAFMKVLNTAKTFKITKEEMPKAIIVISDMEINSFGQDTKFINDMKKEYNEAGYDLPKLVWWNVNARANTFHAEASDDAQFISGSSASSFKSLISGKELSAYELVVQTLDEYDRVITEF